MDEGYGPRRYPRVLRYAACVTCITCVARIAFIACIGSGPPSPLPKIDFEARVRSNWAEKTLSACSLPVWNLKMEARVTFNPAVFSLDVVKTACYKFLDKFSPTIELQDGLIVCLLQIDSRLSEDSIGVEIANLKKEVLDQDLRQRLKIETEPVRNLILAHVFSKTGLIADE